MRTVWQNTVTKDRHYTTLWLHWEAKHGGCECQEMDVLQSAKFVSLFWKRCAMSKFLSSWSQSYERAWPRPLLCHPCSIFTRCQSITTSCLLCLIWHMWCQYLLYFLFSASGSTWDKCLTRLYWKSISSADLTRQTTLIDTVADNQ